MENHDEHRGARIGTRVAHIISQAIVYTHSKLLDVKHKLAVMVFNTISNEISDEVDDTIGPILKRMMRDYDQDGHAAALMNFMAHGRGQFKAIVGSSATAQSLLWALGTVISNELAPISYDLIGASPHLIPDAATIAGFAATGHISPGDAEYQIARNGFNGGWASAWIDSAKQWPSASDLADWYNKQVINRGEYEALAKKAGYDDAAAAGYLGAAFQEVSYQDAALAYLRGQTPLSVVYELAKKQGVASDSVDIYLHTIGEPPGTTDMMEAFRRGFIDQGTLQKGIKQSRVRDEWIPMLEQLRYSPMSTADAVNAAVQGHMDQGEAQRIADENGLMPGHYDVLYQTAGAPLSRTELNDLYNRGVIGSDVVTQGLRESRLKDKYVQDAFALRRRLLEPRTLGEAVNNGAITHDQAIRHAMEAGYTAQDASVLIGAASNRKMQSYREHLVSEVENLYMEGAMSEAQAKSSIASLGHSDAEIQLILETANYKREQRAFQGAVNAIRSRLVSHHIDKGKASSLLDGIGMTAIQRDYLLKIWELEASANVRTLTEAQIIRAIKLQTLTTDDGLKRLIQLGYSEEDAALLIMDI